MHDNNNKGFTWLNLIKIRCAHDFQQMNQQSIRRPQTDQVDRWMKTRPKRIHHDLPPLKCKGCTFLHNGWSFLFMIHGFSILRCRLFLVIVQLPVICGSQEKVNLIVILVILVGIVTSVVVSILDSNQGNSSVNLHREIVVQIYISFYQRWGGKELSSQRKMIVYDYALSLVCSIFGWSLKEDMREHCTTSWWRGLKTLCKVLSKRIRLVPTKMRFRGSFCFFMLGRDHHNNLVW